MPLLVCRVQLFEYAPRTVPLVRRVFTRRTAKLSWRTQHAARLFATKSNSTPVRKSPKIPTEEALEPRPPPPKPFGRDKVPNQTTTASSKPFSFTGTKGKVPPVPTTGVQAYRAELLIYHAGTGLTLFIVTFKLLAVFVFIWCSLAIAPAYYYSPDEETWMAALAIPAGAIPMIIMIFVKPPLVTYIHLVLPQWARMSPERLSQYVQRLPHSAVLDITTVRWLSRRVSRTRVSELYLKNYSTGSITLRRNVPDEVYAARKWYHWRPVKSFLVASKGGKVAEGHIWSEVLNCIRRGWVVEPRYKALKATSK